MSATVNGPRGRDLVAMWIVAIAVAVPALLWVFKAVHSIDVPQSQAFFDYNSIRVEEFHARTDRGALGVVLMGDSHVRYGTELSEELGARLSEEVGREVVVLRLTNDWATFEDFEPLMPAIIDAHPTLMIAQEELRLKNRGLSAGELMKREYLWWQVFGTGVWNPGGLEQSHYQTEMSCEAVGKESIARRRERLDRWIDFDPDGPAAKKVSAWEDQLSELGIDLRYLTVPVATEARAGLPGVEPTRPPSGIAPDITIDDENYCDFVHMDPTARAQYTDWFVRAVGAELSGDLRPASA
jgi:hypothetical protein